MSRSVSVIKITRSKVKDKIAQLDCLHFKYVLFRCIAKKKLTMVKIKNEIKIFEKVTNK